MPSLWSSRVSPRGVTNANVLESIPDRMPATHAIPADIAVKRTTKVIIVFLPFMLPFLS